MKNKDHILSFEFDKDHLSTNTMGLAQLFLHFSISPQKGVEFDPARVLRTLNFGL